MLVAVDFDGVLYPGVGEHEVEDHVLPLYHFPGPLNIVTGRWESSRGKVLAWLKKHHFRVESLVMVPNSALGGNPMEFKRKELVGFDLYITDDPVEARSLATRKLRVLCLEDTTLH